MVKTIVFLFACFVLAVVTDAKPLNLKGFVCDESSQPKTYSVTVEEKPRIKRHLEGLLNSIGDMVQGIIHEAGVHRRERFRYSQINNIGNGEGNTNYITYNVHRK